MPIKVYAVVFARAMRHPKYIGLTTIEEFSRLLAQEMVENGEIELMYRVY